MNLGWIFFLMCRFFVLRYIFSILNNKNIRAHVRPPSVLLSLLKHLKRWIIQLIFKIYSQRFLVKIHFINEKPVNILIGLIVCCSCYKKKQISYIKISWFYLFSFLYICIMFAHISFRKCSVKCYLNILVVLLSLEFF